MVSDGGTWGQWDIRPTWGDLEVLDDLHELGRRHFRFLEDLGKQRVLWSVSSLVSHSCRCEYGVGIHAHEGSYLLLLGPWSLVRSRHVPRTANGRRRHFQTVFLPMTDSHESRRRETGITSGTPQPPTEFAKRQHDDRASEPIPRR